MACRNRDCREILPLKNREIKYQYTSLGCMNIGF